MMKRIKFLLVGFLLAMSNSVLAQNYLYGDVNGDGEVNIADVNAVVSVILSNSHMDNIVGCWVSEYGEDSYGRYEILERDAVSFVFNEDYTGTYTFNKNGVCYIGLRWAQTPDRLFIWYDDGDSDELYYTIDDSGYLLLAQDKHFTSYTAYRPVSSNDGARTDAKFSHQSNREITVMPISRTIKGRSPKN